MRKTCQRAISQGMVEAQKHLEKWRKNGGGQGVRIPDELWREAVDLARAEGIYATAQALRLDYNGLKRRLTSTQDSYHSLPDPARASFVELRMEPSVSGSKTVVELVSRAGDRLRIEVMGHTGIDVVRLAQEVLRRDSTYSPDADSRGGRAG